MDGKVGKLWWEVDAQTTKFDKSLKTTETKTTSLGKKFKSVEGIIKASMGVIAVAAIAKVGVAVAKVAIDLVNVASDAQETSNKFDVVFSEITESANDAAESLSDSFGLSETAAESLLANTADLLSGFGYTQEAALDLSNQVNILAADLGSFANVDVKTASDAITKGLLGEREAMKSLGIAITEADIKQLAEDRGITGELDRQTKSMLTYEIALRQSQNAIGDFERSSTSFANESKSTKAAIEDLKVSLGEVLLPVATSVVDKIGELAESFTDFVEEAQEIKKIEDDAKALEDALKFGTGDLPTIGEAATVVEQEIAELMESMAMLDAQQEQLELNPFANIAERTYTQDAIKDNEERLAALLATKKALEEEAEAEAVAAQAVIDKAEADTQAKIKSDEQAEAEKLRLKALGEYTDFLNGEYLATEEGKVAQLQEEIALIQEGVLLYGDSTEAQTVLIEKQQELKEALGETGDGLKDNKDLWDEWADNAEARIDELSSIGINSLLSSFSDLGEAFVAGELGWDSFATAGLNAIAAVLQALGAQLAAQAALLFAQSFSTLGATLALAAPALAGSAAAYASAGVVSGLAGSFESGGLQPGIPSTTDDRLSSVASGEEVLRADDSRNIANSGESSAGGDVYLDAYKVGYYLAENVYNTGQVLLDGKRAIRK